MNFKSKIKLGIVGGGQLGRMLIQSAIDFDLEIKSLDPDVFAPCKDVAHEFVNGSLLDYQTVVDFGKNCDIVTIEIENVNLEALFELERIGVNVFPQPSVIALIKDKRIQKKHFQENEIPTAAFKLIDNKEEIRQNLDFFPCVNKLGTGGYDGKGVQILRNEKDIDKAFDTLGLIEKLIPFEKELAVVVARNLNGEIKSYPVTEMVFHPEANLVEYLFAPAQIEKTIENAAIKIAEDCAKAFGIVGLLAVEMFLTKEGEILVNEVAPRPHNSGHHTQKANAVSQFEQHIRAILNLPLGDTKEHSLAAMVNILGEAGHDGEAIYSGMEEILQIPGVHPFLYGKKHTKPFRKMGHVSILDKDFEKLKEKVNFVTETLKVKSK